MRRALPGDVVARRKWLVMHKGVVLADGRVLHNSPWKGEHISSESEFRDGHRLRILSTPPERRREVLRRISEPDARPYRLFTNNCEHTVTRVVEGQARSPQLRSWVAGVAVGVLAFAVTRHPAVTVAAYAAARRMVRGSDTIG